MKRIPRLMRWVLFLARLLTQLGKLEVQFQMPEIIAGLVALQIYVHVESRPCSECTLRLNRLFGWMIQGLPVWVETRAEFRSYILEERDLTGYGFSQKSRFGLDPTTLTHLIKGDRQGSPELWFSICIELLLLEVNRWDYCRCGAKSRIITSLEEGGETYERLVP